METITVILLCLMLGLWIVFRKWPPRCSLGPLPPGPIGLPFVGSFFSTGRYEFLTFSAWGKKYGEVCCYQNGSQLIVLLNSHRTIKEAFMGKDDAYNGRPNAPYLRERIARSAGIVLIDGPVWQEHRRFLLRVLRDFGFGRTLSEDVILAEWQPMRARLDAQVGKPMELRPIFIDCINNVIASLAFGERTGSEDPGFSEFTRKLDVFLSSFNFSAMLPVIFPFIMRIEPLLKLVERLNPLIASIDFGHEFVLRKIKEHKERIAQLNDPDMSHANDVCDALLIERIRLERNGVEHSFTDTQVVRDLLELFIAGTDTTATTLSWATFFMATNQEVQERVHREIDEVVGQDRLAAMKDRLDMPYSCAVIDEVQRKSSQVRSGVPHRVLHNTVLHGYAIPKDAVILPNLYGVHHDPDIWTHPQEFYPEHFLDSDGRYKPSEYLIPFSVGKRACLGETLARMESFMFFVAFMQSFHVELADPKADVERIALGSTGNLHRPLSHEVVLTRRT